MKTFRDKYCKNVKSKRIDLSSAKKISALKPGRPLMFGHLDEKIKTFLLALCKKGGAVNIVVVIATAKALNEKSDNELLKMTDCFWEKNIFITVWVLLKELQLLRDQRYLMGCRKRQSCYSIMKSCQKLRNIRSHTQ